MINTLLLSVIGLSILLLIFVGLFFSNKSKISDQTKKISQLNNSVTTLVKNNDYLTTQVNEKNSIVNDSRDAIFNIIGFLNSDFSLYKTPVVKYTEDGVEKETSEYVRLMKWKWPGSKMDQLLNNIMGKDFYKDKNGNNLNGLDSILIDAHLTGKGALLLDEYADGPVKEEIHYFGAVLDDNAPIFSVSNGELIEALKDCSVNFNNTWSNGWSIFIRKDLLLKIFGKLLNCGFGTPTSSNILDTKCVYNVDNLDKVKTGGFDRFTFNGCVNTNQLELEPGSQLLSGSDNLDDLLYGIYSTVPAAKYVYITQVETNTKLMYYYWRSTPASFPLKPLSNSCRPMGANTNNIGYIIGCKPDNWNEICTNRKDGVVWAVYQIRS